MSNRLRLVAATVIATASSIAQPGSAPQTNAAPIKPGYALPIDQGWFNGNYSSGPPAQPGPMDYGVCHHGACNAPLERFWAVDLFAGGSPGQNEYAWEAGTVTESGVTAAAPGWGNHIIFGWDWASAFSFFRTLYAHGNSMAAGTGVGQYVTTGQLVMKMGNTGTTDVHLHFDSRVLALFSPWGDEALTTGTYTAYCARMMLQAVNTNGAVVRSGGFYRPPNTVTRSNCT